jgi:hypothetical protein
MRCLRVVEAFLRAFRWQGAALNIVRMIDVHLPERGLALTPKILARAMYSLLEINGNTKLSHETRQLAQGESARIWQKAQAMGITDTDHMLAARFMALRTTRQIGPLNKMVKRLRNGELSLGPETFFVLLQYELNNADLKRAEALILQGAKYDPAQYTDEEISRQKARQYQLFLRLVLSQQHWSIQAKIQSARRVEERLFAEKIPPKYSASNTGIMWCFLIEHAKSLANTATAVKLISTTKADVFKGIRALPYRSYRPFKDVMIAILSHHHAKFRPGPIEFDIASEILEEAVSWNDDLTVGRAERFWWRFLGPLTSSDLNNKMREEYTNRAIRSLKSVLGEIMPRFRFRIIQALLSRDDERGIGEALRRWDELKIGLRGARSQMWVDMVYSCLRSGRRDVASVIVQDAWEKGEIGHSDGFWKVVMDNELYTRAGIDGDALLEAMRRGGGKTNVKKGVDIRGDRSRDERQSIDELEADLEADGGGMVEEFTA